jgi:hypothetical protein
MISDSEKPAQFSTVTPAAESSSDTMPSKVNQIANVHKLQRKNIIINPPPLPQHNTPQLKHTNKNKNKISSSNLIYLTNVVSDSHHKENKSIMMMMIKEEELQQ